MSFYLLIILGAFLICPAFGFYLPTPAPGSDDERCLNISTAESIKFGKCVEAAVKVSPDLDVAALYDGSSCPRCQHICSRQNDMLECRKKFSEAVLPLNISNAAREMINFSANVFETSLSFLCQNNAEMLGVVYDDEKHAYLVGSLMECNPFIYLYTSPVVYCDFAESNEARERTVCRSLHEVAKCVEEDVKKNKPVLEDFMSNLLNTIRNSEVCAEHIE